MLKKQLISAYKTFIKENKWTYKEVCRHSGLSESQLSSILHHEGKRVSVDKMEDGLINLGFKVVVSFQYLDEVNE